MPILVIQASRHPWVQIILIGCIISGVLGSILPPDPRTALDQYVPGNVRVVYYVSLAVSGLIALIGIWLPKLRDRLWVEMIGMWFVSAPLLVYPFAIIVVTGVPVTPAAVFACMFGVGGLIRIVGIVLELRALRIGREQVNAS